MKWSKYNIEFRMEDDRIGVYHTFNNSFIIIENSELIDIKNQIKNKSIKVSNLTSPLFKNQNIVESDDIFINMLKYKSYLDRFDTTTLNLVIAPTADCNFACPYCFEENKPRWYMDDKTTENLIKFIKSYKKPTNITWFGGEPLLYKKKIIEISMKLKEENIDFYSSILTNGYLLTKGFINELKNLNINRVQVTLDGSEEVHNSHRPHKKGLKTFKRIIKNLDYLIPFASENEIRVNIPVTIDFNNKDDYENIYDFLYLRYKNSVENGTLNISLNFVKDRKDTLSCKMDNQSRVDFFLELADKKKMNKRLVRAYLFPTQNIASCMMRQINSFGIGPKGNIYKCLEEFTDPTKSIGNINKGRLEFEKIAKYTVASDVFDDTTCRSCSMLPICIGGCPYDMILDHEKQYSGNNCTIYKNNLDKVLNKYYIIK